MGGWKDELQKLREKLPKSLMDGRESSAPKTQVLQQSIRRGGANSVRVVSRSTVELRSKAGYNHNQRGEAAH